MPRPMNKSWTNALVLMLALLGAGGARAQNSRSQLAVVSQTIAGTRVEIVYRRPAARGRPLFGSLARWGLIWTASADTAARLATTVPLRVNGSEPPAGTYS